MIQSTAANSSSEQIPNKDSVWPWPSMPDATTTIPTPAPSSAVRTIHRSFGDSDFSMIPAVLYDEVLHLYLHLSSIFDQ
jgi:hypothetical protein